MPLSDIANQQASHYMTQIVGSAISVALLAADDYEGTKANLLKAIEDFPEAMRSALPPADKTAVIAENVQQVRWHSRELYRILSGEGAQTPAETPPEAA
jgi:hypothetical protein